MKRILVAFPTQWDRRQLDACAPQWRDDYEVVYGEPGDHDCPWELDVPAWVDRTVAELRNAIDGVFSSSDYPGATAAACVAVDLGLPGTRPGNVLHTTHKYYSRIIQSQAVPDAVPPFALVDPKRPGDAPDIGFPCFVKPVRAAFSLFSKRIESQETLTAFLESDPVREFLDYYVAMFDGIREARSTLEISGRHFIAEAPLSGFQVTVEGYRHRGEPVILGVVDSVMYPDSHSFARFDYPSFLGPAIQERMASIAGRTAGALGLEETLFNVEMFYDPGRDRITIIEVNPRLCGQFADLYEKVDGINSYRVAMDLAAGRTPEVRRREGRWVCASSFPLRVFEPCRFQSVPDGNTIRSVERSTPGALVWTEVQSGDEISDFTSGEDGFSARYAIVNLGAESREDLAKRFDAVVSSLRFQIVPLGVP